MSSQSTKKLNTKYFLAKQQGWVMVSGLLLFPSLLLLSVATAILLQLFKQRQNLFHLCQQSALHMQKNYRSHLLDLFALNSRAKKIHQERRFARRLLQTSTNPLQAQAAMAMLQALRIREKILVGQQRYHILRPKQKAHSYIYEIKKKLKKQWDIWPPIQFHIPTLAVRGQFPSPPTYKAKKFFSQQQLVSLHWKVPFATFLPKVGPLLIHKAMDQALSIKVQCAASLIKEKRWPVKLRLVDKFSWKL